MNCFSRRHFFRPAARWLCALLAALALPINAPAQPANPQRWLFIFDLSPAMQKRLPATATALKEFFATSAGGQLQAGDSIGVWTFDQKLHTGQFPLVVWNPNYATALTTNLIGFLRAQKFTLDSQLSVLQPVLGNVVAGSERLTVVIFCDGQSEISATPFDSGINQNFRDSRAERKKNQQPFVVLIRTLAGKYLGCTVNYPPGAINLPPFPVPPPVAPPTPVVAAVQSAPVAVPDLVIVGTNVGATASASPASKPVEAPKIIVIVTNPAPAPVSNIPPAKTVTPASNHVAIAMVACATNSVPPPVPTSVITPATNASVAASNNLPAPPARRWIHFAVGLLAVGAVLAVILIIRANRRPRGSLISSSMQDDPPRK